MNTYIALLKGINVGGHKKVPMATLRDILSTSSLENVKTYIQSGNVFFESAENSTTKLEVHIKNVITSHFGFDVVVIVKTRAELQHIFNICPFSKTQKENSYFALLSETPTDILVKEVSQKIYENDTYHIINNCIYFYCANGYGKAKFNLNYFERKLNLTATARNFKTMVKLLALSE